jgi:hypothetical protein
MLTQSGRGYIYAVRVRYTYAVRERYTYAVRERLYLRSQGEVIITLLGRGYADAVRERLYRASRKMIPYLSTEHAVRSRQL